jgi:NADPH-dependent glutamate synthase beta subunit-like oxidoreductase
VELADYGKYLPRAEAPTGKKVAIIGAGPGGLAAAYYLALLGHGVTVFEKDEAAGGMLRYGIPEYRLPYPALDKDIAWITSLGVQIHYGKAVGKDITLASLYGDYDAVFLSTGLAVAYKLDVPGDSHPRVLDGVAILAAATRGEPLGLGKKVAVVGGGNVAMDAARTALRNGAEVDIVYRRREVDMPADPEEIREAKAEGAVLIPQAIPLEVKPASVTDAVPAGTRDAGSPASAQATFVWNLAEMVQKEPGKRPVPEPIPGAVVEKTYDSIIAAIGQGPDLSYVAEADGIELKRYKPVISPDGRTSRATVFAGGDLTNDRKDAISAIADGHRAALAMDRLLAGKEA